jgi:hypothetical protein
MVINIPFAFTFQNDIEGYIYLACRLNIIFGFIILFLLLAIFWQQGPNSWPPLYGLM